MIFNNTKIVYFRPPCAGSSIITENLTDKFQKNLYDSQHLFSYLNLNVNKRVKDYVAYTKGMPPHLSRRMFDDMFTGNRQDFFYFTIIRNPWDQVLSAVRYVIHRQGYNIPFTLDYKKEINEIISDLYSTNRYIHNVVARYLYTVLIDNRGDILDYDYIIYFEDIHNDIQQLTGLSGLEFKNPLEIKSKPIDYREYYTQQNLDLISWHREKDAEAFGYDFEKGLLFKNNQPKINDLSKKQIINNNTKRKMRVKNSNSSIQVIM